jgi:Mg2+ and Co2+ transporter CorA
MTTGYEVAMYRDISMSAKQLAIISTDLERMADELKQLRELIQRIASNIPAPVQRVR